MNLGIGLLHERQPRLALFMTLAKVQFTAARELVDLVQDLVIDNSRYPVAIFEENESVNANLLVPLDTELFQESWDVRDNSQRSDKPAIAHRALCFFPARSKKNKSGGMLEFVMGAP